MANALAAEPLHCGCVEVAQPSNESCQWYHWSARDVASGIYVLWFVTGHAHSFSPRSALGVMGDPHPGPQCRLISGFFAIFLQGFLGCVCLSSLAVKRHMEKPKREFKIFVMDIAKQACGAGFVHFANIFVSIALATSSELQGDRCAIYFMNFFIDCTVGVAVVYWLQYGMRFLWMKLVRKNSSVEKIGYYGEAKDGSRRYLIWAKQCSIFLVALAINKFIVAAWLKFMYSYFNMLGNIIFGPVQDTPNTELVIVMVVCPGFLTMLQMWLFDHFLKDHSQKADQLLSNATDRKSVV